MQYKILEENEVYRGFLRVRRALIQHDTFSGHAPLVIDRECMDRGDGVAVLLHETDTGSILLTNQFRYPTIRHDEGWLLELPAGTLDPGEDPRHCAIREVEEELGYHIEDCIPISSFYVSPGGVSERMFLFYAEVTQADRRSEGGGKAEEMEDIQLIRQPVSQLPSLLDQGHFKDAKTIVALQWFINRRIVRRDIF